MIRRFFRPLQRKRLACAIGMTLGALTFQAEAGNASNTQYFNHLATFDVMAENGSGVAEIIDVSADGTQLAYTDAENGAVGFINIRHPANPRGQGSVELGGEPTSLVIKGPWVIIGVNTSESFTNPSGKLVVINRFNQNIIAEHALAGQPDSLALSPDKKRVAIVLENERDEDYNGGLLPQYPTGGLVSVLLKGAPNQWQLNTIDLSDVAAAAPFGDDLEPEYVDINADNEAVVSFQENNYFAIVDMISGSVLNHFPAGEVTLKNVDTEEEDLIHFDSTITKRREPDAVSWIDCDTFASANEGDYEDANGEEGGSRSFTLFNQDGTVEYESAESFEHLIAKVGQYNESRSENKGVEPEAVEFGQYGKSKLLFVGSERSNMVGVYDVKNSSKPKLRQILPTGIAPEGLKAIPQKNLFVAATETEVADDGIPTMVNIYRYGAKQARYPMIESVEDTSGNPIPWVALSGLAGDPVDNSTVYAVSDSFLASGFIYTIDVSQKPAQITDRIEVTGASFDLDLEGIAVGKDGSFWVASEGDAEDRPNAILKVAANGSVLEEIFLPDALEANARSNGFEGVAVTGKPGKEVLYAAIQRAWPDAGDEDGVETKLGRYDVASGEWTFVHYPLEAETEGGWIGLSDLTLLPNGKFAVIERDKGWGESTGPVAGLKSVFQVNLTKADFRSLSDSRGLVTLKKHLLVDALPTMQKRSVWTAEKLEGFAVTRNGKTWLATDNDGVDDATGETLFFSLGNIHKLCK